MRSHSSSRAFTIPTIRSAAVRRFAAVISLIALGASGCALSTPDPAMAYHPSGDVTSFKRQEAHPQRDFVHHFIRKAYRAANDDFDFASEEQEVLLEEWGRPTYLRNPFSSIEGEKVEEWVYLDQQRIFQFIDRGLVYEGPFTDFEMLLIRYGYPDRIQMTMSNMGPTLQKLFYRAMFGAGRLDIYVLSDGWLDQAVLMN